MLTELPSRQAPGEPRRRWFRDEDFDLIVWLAHDGAIDGFQLCYTSDGVEHALTWTRTGGYSHNRIDDGEGGAAKNQTPILVADGRFPGSEVVSGFEQHSAQLDATIRAFVIAKARAYTNRSAD